MATTSSPLKSLERLSEELRSERQKAQHAFQERSRLKVELETLKQTVELQRHESRELQMQLEQERDQVRQWQRDHQQLVQAKQALEEEVQQEKLRWFTANEEKESLRRELTALQTEQWQRQEEWQALKLTQSHWEQKLLAKDQLIATLKQELLDLRKDAMDNEKNLVELQQQLQSQWNERELLDTQRKIATTMEQSEDQSRINYDDLRYQLEQSLALTASLNQQIAVFNAKLAEASIREQELQTQVQRELALRNELENQQQDLERDLQDLQQHVASDTQSRQLLLQRVEQLQHHKDQAEQQMQEATNDFQQACEDNKGLKQQLLSYKQVIDEQKQQLQSLQQQLQAAPERDQNLRQLDFEVQSLRSQLSTMRKQLLKREVEQEANVLTPKQLADREQSSRQLYEGIIADLRQQLESSQKQYEDALQKSRACDVLQQHVITLQEELQMHREMLQSIAVENQTVTMTASEVTDRSVKYLADKQQLLSKIAQATAQSMAWQTEITTYKSEIATLRDKLKTYHQSRLQAEKRVAELLTENAKLEAANETLQQQLDHQQLELQHSQLQLQDRHYTVTDVSQLQRQLQELQHQLQHCQEEKRVLEGQVHQRTQQTEREKQMLHQQCHFATKQAEKWEDKVQELQEEISQLQTCLSTAKREATEHLTLAQSFKQQFEDLQTSYTQHQVSELKKELETTVEDLEKFEYEQNLKERMIQELKLEVSKEKEQNQLLQMQLTLAHEKVQVLQQLSSYRQHIHHGLETEAGKLTTPLPMATPRYPSTSGAATPRRVSSPTLSSPHTVHAAALQKRLLLTVQDPGKATAKAVSAEMPSKPYTNGSASRLSLEELQTTTPRLQLGHFRTQHASSSGLSVSSEDTQQLASVTSPSPDTNAQTTHRLARRQQREQRLRELVMAQERARLAATAPAMASARREVGMETAAERTGKAERPTSGLRQYGQSLAAPKRSQSPPLPSAKRRQEELEKARKILSM